jgi:hypothetical protein
VTTTTTYVRSGSDGCNKMMDNKIIVWCPDCCVEVSGSESCECGLIWVRGDSYGISSTADTDWTVSDLQVFVT